MRNSYPDMVGRLRAHFSAGYLQTKLITSTLTSSRLLLRFNPSVSFFTPIFSRNLKAHTSLSGENELLQTEIRRLELAIQSTENPLHIARDCLSNRQRRVDTDLVQDDAENNLLKVIEVLAQNNRQ